MSNQNWNPTTPDPGQDPDEAVPGYQPPQTGEPDAPQGYQPPASAAGEPEVPPAYQPPASTDYPTPTYGAPAPGGYPPPASGYEPPAAYPPASPPYGQPPAAPYGQPPATPYGQPSADYGQPAPGGYPPATPYGQPPYGQNPGYAGPGYAAPPAFSIGSAFNYGWTKFQSNFGPIVLVTLVAAGAMLLLGLVGGLILSALPGSPGYFDPSSGIYVPGTGGVLTTLVGAVFQVLSAIVGLMISVGLVRAALDITYGRPISVATVFRTDDLVSALIANVIIGIAVVVGLLLCVIPGLIVAFFTQFTLYFVVDKKMPAIEAIKSSFSFVNKNLGSLIGLYLASLVAVAVGALLCGIGALIAIPVVGIATAYAYRTLQGEAVAA